MVFAPTELVLGKIMRHITSTPTPPIPGVNELTESAVALGKADPNFSVSVRVRPPLEREGGMVQCIRSYEVTSEALPGKDNIKGEEVCVHKSAA